MIKHPYKPKAIHANGHDDGIWRRPHHCPYCQEKFRHLNAFRAHVRELHDLECRIDGIDSVHINQLKGGGEQ